MKKLPFIVCFVIIFGCSDDDNVNCNFLLNVGVNLTVNINLPQFSQLEFVNNPIKVDGFGNEGIILIRANADTLLAWDAADPSHTPSACSSMTINGINATCNCGDDNEFILITGAGVASNTQPCTLKPYRVEFVGNNTYLVSN